MKIRRKWWYYHFCCFTSYFLGCNCEVWHILILEGRKEVFSLMCKIFLRFWESLIVKLLKIRIKQKIIYKAILSINFLQIVTRLVAIYIIRLNTTLSRVLSQNKLVLWLSQPKVLSLNPLVMRIAKYNSQNNIISILV